MIGERGHNKPVSAFNEFEQRLKSAKNRFQLSAGLNLEKLNTILSGTKTRLKFFKFDRNIIINLILGVLT